MNPLHPDEFGGTDEGSHYMSQHKFETMKEQPKSRENLKQGYSRENGYYWVNYGGDWIISKYFGNVCWAFDYNDLVLSDSDFEEIDERKISRVSGEPPKPDLKQSIIDGQRLRLSQLHEACEWCVNQLTPFSNMEAMGPLESFRLREITNMLNGEKVSGEAKTPDQYCEVYKKEPCFQKTCRCELREKELGGGSVPTPSDQELEAEAEAMVYELEWANTNVISLDIKKAYKAGRLRGSTQQEKTVN